VVAFSAVADPSAPGWPSGIWMKPDILPFTRLKQHLYTLSATGVRFKTELLSALCVIEGEGQRSFEVRLRRCRNRSTPTTSRVWGRTRFRRRGSTTMWTRRLGTKLCLECLLRAQGRAPHVPTDSRVRRKRSPGHTGEHTVFGATPRASSAAGACCAAVLLFCCSPAAKYAPSSSKRLAPP
jgi:hypothetical protein